jgi:hypothetical protein
VRIIFALAAIIVVAGCRRSDDEDRRGDTIVTPPVSVDSLARVAALDCGSAGLPVMTDEGIGDLEVGRSVDELRATCEVISDANEQGSEGGQERVVVFRVDGQAVRTIVADEKIYRIEVLSPRVLTTDSLGVDTPLRTIATRPDARFLPGEDGVYGFLGEHCAMSFRFSVPLRPPRGSDWTAAAINAAHGDAAVDKVLITRCRR